jgi:hypothetical protein
VIQVIFEPNTKKQAEVLAKAIFEYLSADSPGAVAEANVPDQEAPKKRGRPPGSKAKVAAEDPESLPETSTTPPLEEESSAAPDAAPEEAPAPAPAPAVTIQQVRLVLAEKSRAGKTAEVHKLLAEFGAAKLTEVPAESYESILEKASAL